MVIDCLESFMFVKFSKQFMILENFCLYIVFLDFTTNFTYLY